MGKRKKDYMIVTKNNKKSFVYLGKGYLSVGHPYFGENINNGNKEHHWYFKGKAEKDGDTLKLYINKGLDKDFKKIGIPKSNKIEGKVNIISDITNIVYICNGDELSISINRDKYDELDELLTKEEMNAILGIDD